MNWESIAAAPPLTSDAVHIWRLKLDEFTFSSSDAADILSEAEQRRATAFHRRDDRERFAKTRAVLRRLLSAYTGISPTKVPLGVRSTGKPFLIRRDGRVDVRFNVSHSGDMALLAFANGREIGVDLEFLHRVPELLEVFLNQFSRNETAQLGKIPAHERWTAFYECWSRKEAALKALGDGLGVPLASFSVPVSEIAGTARVEIASPRGEETVTLLSLAEIPGYASAAAVQGDAWFVPEFFSANAFQSGSVARCG